MSFLEKHEKVSIGDIVGLYSGFNRLLHFKVEPGQTQQTKFGALHHNDLIGVPFGSKVPCSKGWMYVLRLTPELWTITLPHRTQILYSTDISMITMQLELKPGSVVVEAGTGSGSLSHALIRSVAPGGHLYTFDFHEQRAQTARSEFDEHGLAALVTARHRDVCADGFDVDGRADAVFLDLPKPWEALHHVKAAIRRSGGRVCSFSPCIEQVQRTCQTMEELQFKEIRTMECLVREYNIQSISMTVPDLGEHDCSAEYSLPAGEPPVGRTVRAGELSAAGREEGGEEEGKEEEEGEGEEGETVAKGNPRKRKMERASKKPPLKGEVFQFKTAVPRYTMPGHTGYLTFATVYH